MHLFFQPDIDIDTDTFFFSEEESKHCIKVLRFSKGNMVNVANGKGLCIEAEIIDANAKKCQLKSLKKQEFNKVRNYYVTLFIAPTKNTDRLEWLIEKATEIGIDECYFIETKRSERSRLNLDRLNKIAISGMKQSKQWWLPKLHQIVGFEDGVNLVQTNAQHFIGWCMAAPNLSLAKQLEPKTKILGIWIGPEGDFTDEEINLAKDKGIKPVWLGNEILRTETAALFVLSAIKTLIHE